MQDSEDGNRSPYSLLSSTSSNPSRQTFYEAPTFDDDRPWGLRLKFKDPAYGDVRLVCSCCARSACIR